MIVAYPKSIAPRETMDHVGPFARPQRPHAGTAKRASAKAIECPVSVPQPHRPTQPCMVIPDLLTLWQNLLDQRGPDHQSVHPLQSRGWVGQIYPPAPPKHRPWPCRQFCHHQTRNIGKFLNVSTCDRAFCPVVASNTNNVLCGASGSFLRITRTIFGQFFHQILAILPSAVSIINRSAPSS